MKKISCWVISCLLYSASFSQTFSILASDTIKYAAPTGMQFGCYDSLVNNSSTGFFVNVVRVQNDTAPKWQTGMCLDVCYPPSTDSASVYLLPNSSQVFILDFFPDTVPDSSSALIKFVNASNPSNVFYQRYHGITKVGVGVAEHSQKASVKIFPSPVISGTPFCFRITAKTNSDFALMIYDMIGKKFVRFDDLIAGDNYLAVNLTEGMYVYTLLKGNERVKTGKLSVSK